MKTSIPIILAFLLFGCANENHNDNSGEAEIDSISIIKTLDSVMNEQELQVKDNMFRAWSKDTTPVLLKWLDRNDEFVTKKWIEFNEDSTISIVYSDYRYNSKYTVHEDKNWEINALISTIRQQGKLPKVPYEFSFTKEEWYNPVPVFRGESKTHFDNVRLSYGDSIITFFYRRGDLDVESIEVKK